MTRQKELEDRLNTARHTYSMLWRQFHTHLESVPSSDLDLLKLAYRQMEQAQEAYDRGISPRRRSKKPRGKTRTSTKS